MTQGASSPSWFGWNSGLTDRMRRSLAGWGSANQVSQPILPGWTFALNSINSTAPQTEASILAEHSYGRQIGRIEDALARILDGRDDLADDAAIRDFRAMKAEIDAVKARSAADGVDRIVADVTSLKATDPTRYTQLRAALLRTLDDPTTPPGST